MRTTQVSVADFGRWRFELNQLKCGTAHRTLNRRRKSAGLLAHAAVSIMPLCSHLLCFTATAEESFVLKHWTCQDTCSDHVAMLLPRWYHARAAGQQETSDDNAAQDLSVTCCPIDNVCMTSLDRI